MEDNKNQYLIGFDPYKKDVGSEESRAVVLKRTEPDGKVVVEYLGRPNEVPFPELIEEMKNYYGNWIIEEKPKALIAIDPGANGAIVIETPQGVISHKMPDTPKDVFDLFKNFKNDYDVECMLEKVGGMPKMGGSSMFNFGQGYGHIEMALIANGIKTTTTSPQAWQKTMLIGTKSKLSTTEWKNKLKAKAQQLYPQLKVTLGNADALLILEYFKNLKK